MGETPGAARRRSAEQTAVGLGRQQPGVGISISRMSGFVGRYRDDAPDGTAGAARCRRHGPTIGASANANGHSGSSGGAQAPGGPPWNATRPSRRPIDGPNDGSERHQPRSAAVYLGLWRKGFRHAGFGRIPVANSVSPMPGLRALAGRMRSGPVGRQFRERGPGRD